MLVGLRATQKKIQNCDAERTSAGVQLENLPQQGQFFSILPDSSSIFSQTHSKFGRNPSKTLPKSPPNGAKIDPEGLLEPIWDESFNKAWFWRPKKRPRSAQERPREAPARPKPLPNGGQDPPRIDFWAIFWPLFSHSEFALFFHLVFIDFLLNVKGSNP